MLDSGIISEDEIAYFEANGFFVTKEPVLSREVIDDALFGVERYYQGERDFTLPVSGGYLDWRPEHGGLLRINDYVSLQNVELRELRNQRSMARMAAALLRIDGVRLFHDQLITKQDSADDATVVGWHTDQSYWHTCTSEKLITAWIPLTQPTPNSGGICVIRGSHKWSGTGDLTTFREQDLHALESRLRQGREDFEIVHLDVPLGHASFHHARAVHGSFSNSSGAPRTALTIHFQDSQNRYRPYLANGPNAKMHVNDVLCLTNDEGHPDYTDPEICPLLWPIEEEH